MQTLTVKNIEEKHTKDGTKSFFIITDNTGASFSLWEPIGMIKPGCVLEADIEVKGKYANIKDFKITSQPASEASVSKPATSAYGQDSPEKRRSIERQTSAQIAFAFGLAPDITVVDRLKIAEQIYQWISEGKMPTPTKPTAPPSTPSDAQKQPVKSDPPSPAPKQIQTVPKITSDTVYSNLRKLVDQGWTKEKVLELFNGLAPLPGTTKEMLASLSQENLLQVNARINQTLLKEAAKKIGAEEVKFE